MRLRRPRQTSPGRMVSFLRWHLKKAARRGVAWESGLTRYLPSFQARGALPRLRALTYHSFGDRLRDPFCVTVENFEDQVAYLAKEGLAVSLRQMEEFLAGKI